MRILYTLCLFFICLLVNTFDVEARKPSSPKQLLRNAYYYYEYQNYGYALNYFEEYLKQDSSNIKVNFETAECYYFARSNRELAIPLYESAKEMNSLSLLRLGQIYHEQAQFANARAVLNGYLQTQTADSVTLQWITEKLKQIDRAENAMKQPHDAEIIPLPDSINSEYPDYVPVVTPEGQFMFFTSRRPESTGGLTDPNGEYFEDIYMSENIDGFWSKAVNLGKPVNSDTHDACLGITSDMQTMFIYRTNPKGTGGNIYESHLKNGKWGKPSMIEATFNLTAPDVKVISLTVAPDSISYYYVSNQPGGYGGTDIYKVVRFGPNFWSKPYNLGPLINTPEDEDSPFFHYDDKTMYFSSKGHDSYGSFDVFKSELQDDGSWGKPENVGYPISTVADDRSFIKMPDGHTCYFSTRNEQSNNSQDIFVAYMPKRDVNYAVVRGLVKDQNENAVKCELRVLHADTKKTVGVYRPNLLTGKFVLLLPPSGHYQIEVLKDREVIEEIEFDVPEKVSVLFDQLTIILQINN